MAILPILKLGDPRLRERAEDVTPEALESAAVQRFIDDLVETMRDARGAGLAATQVGSPLRICAIEVQDNPRYPYKPNIPLTVLVNPVLSFPEGGETFMNYEGCLSVPDLRGEVERHAVVEIAALARDGSAIRRTVRGLSAGTFQHEVDHLDGLLFVDRVRDTRTLTTWEEFDRHHKAAFVDRITAFIARMGG